MYNYTYTPVTIKVVCNILKSPETSLQWPMGSYSLNPHTKFLEHLAE